ncbi:hypothetical protein J3Q64DRAFT_1724881 [Phycomyces blakesleeanus]|uniref:Uncharacterized protein n=1 Tax=Phycomyces blakesleeanus TaxID=4837 RepID=A0ABR3B6S7_PHYBL
MDILTKTHVEQMDEAIATILQLESNIKNTESIDSKFNLLSIDYITGTNVRDVHESNMILEEEAILETELVPNRIEGTDALVLSFNDMINAIEDEIERCKAEESSIYSDGSSEFYFPDSETTSKNIEVAESIQSVVFETESSLPKEDIIMSPVEVQIEMLPENIIEIAVNDTSDIITSKVKDTERQITDAESAKVVSDREANVASAITAAKNAIEYTEKVTANIVPKNVKLKQIEENTAAQKQKEETAKSIDRVHIPALTDRTLPPLVPSLELATDDSDDAPEEVSHAPLFTKTRYDTPPQKQTQRPLFQTRDQLSKVIPSIFRHNKKKDKEDITIHDRNPSKSKDSTDMSHTNFVLSMIQEQQRHASEDISGQSTLSLSQNQPVFHPIPMDFRRMGQSSTTNPQHYRSSEQAYRQEYPINRFQSAQPLSNQSKTRMYPDISQTDLFISGYGPGLSPKNSSNGLYQPSFSKDHSAHPDTLVQEPFKKVASNDHLYSSSTLYHTSNLPSSKEQWRVHKALQNKSS